MFSEDFSLEGGGSQALTALRKNYRVVPISVASPAELARGRLLLMAQPIAQPAEILSRSTIGCGPAAACCCSPIRCSNGRARSRLATRPATAHVRRYRPARPLGLRLDAPDQRGPRKTTLDGSPVLTVSAGAVEREGLSIGSGGLVAHCQIGGGSATVIADADLLNAEPSPMEQAISTLSFRSLHCCGGDLLVRITDLSTGLSGQNKGRTTPYRQVKRR